MTCLISFSYSSGNSQVTLSFERFKVLMVFPFRAHQFRTEIKRLAPCWWFIYNHCVTVEAVLICSISLLETLMGVFYTKVCTQRKYEKYQNGFGTWSMQSPFDHLNFVPKKIWFCSSVGKALVSQVSTAIFSIKSPLCMKNLAVTKSENTT